MICGASTVGMVAGCAEVSQRRAAPDFVKTGAERHAEDGAAGFAAAHNGAASFTAAHDGAASFTAAHDGAASFAAHNGEGRLRRQPVS